MAPLTYISPFSGCSKSGGFPSLLPIPLCLVELWAIILGRFDHRAMQLRLYVERIIHFRCVFLPLLGGRRYSTWDQCCQVYDNYCICTIILPCVRCTINNPQKGQIYNNLTILWMCGYNRIFLWTLKAFPFPCDKFQANRAFLCELQVSRSLCFNVMSTTSVLTFPTWQHCLGRHTHSAAATLPRPQPPARRPADFTANRGRISYHQQATDAQLQLTLPETYLKV